MNASPPILDYLQTNVFDIVNEVKHHAELKTVLSVGKPYYNLFENLGFKKIKEITPENYSKSKVKGWPRNKKNELTKRFFSLWKHDKTGTDYFNTYSYGSNTPPSIHWNQIQSLLIE